MFFKNIFKYFKKASVCPAAVRASWPTEKCGPVVFCHSCGWRYEARVKPPLN